MDALKREVFRLIRRCDGMDNLIRPAAYGLGLTILWLLVAIANGSTTYHLAPLLISVAVPIGASLTDRIGLSTAAVAGAIGIGLTYLGTTVLASADRLTGPSLLPIGGAVLEAIVFGAVGAVAGFTVAAARPR